MPNPKSDKTPKRKPARKPRPKSLLTQADIEAIRRLIREDLDSLRADLRAEFRDRTSALAGQVSALAGQVLGLDAKVGSLDAEFRDRTSALAGQVLGLDAKVGSLDQRLTELEGRVRLLPTRDEFFSRTDELLTELRALREEYLTLSRRVSRLEEVHPGGQHP